MRNIINSIMRSEGFSEADIAYHNLTLKEKRALLPNPHLPADKAFILETGTDAITLTLDSAAALCAEAVELGVISQPLHFPPLVKDLPVEAYWHEVSQNFISPFMTRMNGTYMVYLSGEKIYAKHTSNDDIYTVSSFLNLEETPELLEHVMERKRAILNISGLTPTWMTEFNHELLTEHNKATKARNDCLSQWQLVYRQVRDAKDPVVIAKRAANAEAMKALAINKEKQQQGIENLPFKWKSNIKQVLSGLSESSNGDGCKRNTVVHVWLLEDFKRGRFSRKKYDYLCSPKKTSNWSDGSISDDEITCKTCLQRAAKLYENQGA